jgi:uncharacterized protein (UPF0335 family)
MWAETELRALLNKLSNKESHRQEIGDCITDKYDTIIFWQSDMKMLKNIVLQQKKNGVNEKKRNTREQRERRKMLEHTPARK